MSTKKYDDITNLKSGNFDYKIKVRVIRFWRGVSTSGEEFKGFNVLLLDNKNISIHAFVPAMCAYEHEKKLKLGNVCLITKFTVQQYKNTDIFRSVRNEKQLLFSKNTKIQDIEETGSNIQKNWFDLYDHSDLKALSQQNMYLADVVGIIKEHLPFTSFKNKHGKQQSQAKFTLTDGSSNVKVTFWDKFGDNFEKDMEQVLDKNVIIIIASCRVGIWNEEVTLSNVAATKFFLNYQHHSVMHLKQMLTIPEFKQQVMASTNKKKVELLTVEQILQLGREYIDIEVITHVKVKYVEENNLWYYYACTSCHYEAEIENGKFFCIKCNRKVIYPEMKFKISVVACDGSGPIQIILDDREVRTLLGKRAIQIAAKQEKDGKFPAEIKTIGNKPYTVKISIREANVVNKMKVFWGTNICNGFQVEDDDKVQICDSMKKSTTQETTSTSTYHLDGLSDLNFKSTQVQKNKGKEVEINLSNM